MQLPHIAFTWYDALDIVLTAYIVYVVLLLIRGTRAIQILQGVAIVLVLRLIAEYLHLWTVFSILDGLLIASGVAIPIVFQPELRRALAHLGTGGFVEGRAAHGGIASADVVCAVLGRSGSVLSERGVGAIFVVERGTGLEEYVESGRVLDARLSSELVLSLFTPKAPLHDGAIIIRGERVAAAGCFLPLSDNANLTPVMGTRHRAALGITEQTDAVAMLVSEETGDVELAVGGVIVGCGSSADAIASALRPLLSRASPSSHQSFVDRIRMLWNRGNGVAHRFGTTKLRP